MQAGRRRKRGAVGRAEIAGERESIRHAALDGAPQTTEGWAVQIALVRIRAKLSPKTVDQVGSAGNDCAGSEAQSDNGQGKAMPGWQPSPRGRDDVHSSAACHNRRTS